MEFFKFQNPQYAIGLLAELFLIFNEASKIKNIPISIFDFKSPQAIVIVLNRPKKLDIAR